MKLDSLYTFNEKADRYFIDFDKVFSRNALFYYIFGEKSLGKTYGMTGYLYHHFLKTGRNFVYLRRRKLEWQSTRTNIFTDYFKKEHINKEVKYESLMLYIRDKKPRDKDEKEWKKEHPWKFFGGTYTLENYGEVQGVAFDKVDTIFLDEFMIYNKQKRWIPDEANALQNIAQTVFRDNVKKYNCKVVACSNAGSIANPYFMAYDVQPGDFLEQNLIWRDKVLFINCPKTNNENEFISQTATESYKKFAVDNNFLDDTSLLVLAKQPKASTPLFTIYVSDEKYYTVYKAPQNYIFVGKVKNNLIDCYAGNRKIQNDRAVYNVEIIKYLKKAFNNRELFFANSFIKKLFLDGIDVI